MWAVEAFVDPSGSPVGRVEFDVEDFVPQKLKVTLETTTPVLSPGEPIGATVEGAFLYGAPAAGLAGEAELRITRDPAPVPEAKDYRFGLVEEKIEDQVQQLTMANADDQGHTEIEDVLQPPAKTTAPLKAVLSAGLFDPGGRIVKDQIELPIRTLPLLIGIKPRFAEDRTPEDKDAQFDIRVFDDARQPVARQNLEWRLIREDHVFDWFARRRDSGRTFYYHVVDRPIASGNIDVAATGPAVLTQPVEWGDYRLVVDDPATQVATSVRFHAGWFKTAESAETPDKVSVTVDQASYSPGAIARIRVEPPFAGKAELTIAGDRVFETRAVTLPKEGATFNVKVSPDWGAGAYAILSLYRPLDQGRARDPVRAIGVAWLGLDPKPHTLDVAIEMPDKVTPRQRITVPLKLEGAARGEPTYVTLAAVDEGILQLTRFHTPDPADFFFGKRRLGIDIRDDYGRLLDNSAAVGPIREGGDTTLGGPSLPVTSTRTVALFAGPVTVGPEGTAQVELDIPDFEGQLRLMAVAYNRDAVGRGEAKLIVRDPVIADLALPRFLAPDDKARLAVQLHNTDGVAGNYHLALTSAGAARITADHPLDYALGTSERKLDNVMLEGFDEGIASITADLTGPEGYAVHREWQIAVRGAHYPMTIEDAGLQAPGTAFRLDAQKLQPFVPGSVTVSLGYSAFGGIDIPSLLQSLYQYPYGCTEQMSSVAFPLL
ncbi:MAG: alpha-2-macroglobulin family protein, partial [Alphaproteobacteria bacterium]|nr:alpha-2-macroglobulin family protein [Alphaproteobacteria bacterium]